MTVMQATRSPRWRSFALLSAGSFFIFWVWYSKSTVIQYPGHTAYVEEGVELSSFAHPFKCDIESLAPTTRLVRRTRENYAIFCHGFTDLISDAHWNGEGNFGWEEDLSEHMAAYMAVIQSLEPTRDTFMDLGANIATHSLYLASKGYNVHAFEPVHANYVLARCSIALSDFKGQVRLNTFGVGDKVQESCVTTRQDNLGDSRLDREFKDCPESDRAHVSTLDNYYQKFLRGQPIAVAKMDIQGYEIPALRAGKQLFGSEDAPVAVFYEFEPDRIKFVEEDPQDLSRYFVERDYTIFEVQNLSGMTQEELAAKAGTDTGYIDMLAVKNDWIERFQRAGSAGYRLEGGRLNVTSGHGPHG